VQGEGAFAGIPVQSSQNLRYEACPMYYRGSNVNNVGNKREVQQKTLETREIA
jgi:hypothetical protein